MLEFTEQGHVYTWNGKPVPSVTQILDVLNDFSRVPWDVLERAKDRGTRVHRAGELLLREELDWSSLDDEVRPYIVGLQKFLDDTKFVPLTTGTKVYHESLGYAGAIDCTGFWRNGHCIVDWKTSVATPRTVGPQLSAYLEALNTTRKTKITRRYCIRLQADGTYKVDPQKTLSDFTIFKSALNLWRYSNAD